MTTENKPEREYEFYAFISYKRGGEDEKWAKMIQRRLESYRIPVADLSERLGGGRPAQDIPRRLRVFRDKTDLGSHSNLQQGLSSSLESSRYLIAICSPRSAESPYVDAEVRYFAEVGRSEYIIPFAIGGALDSCYPPSLPPDISGVTLSSGTDEEAFIHLLARMLRVDYSELYQTHLRAARRRAARMLSAVAAVLALTTALGLWAVSAGIRATTYRVESEALVDFLTFDLIREAAPYISTQARASITDKVREHYERWEPREPKTVYAKAVNLRQRGGVAADHDPQGALELELQSLALLEKLNRDSPGNENYFAAYSDALLGAGRLLEVMGESEEAVF
ncbi:MAG: toll/interleukin-1 receptor domain-containing protein, partial [Synergistaceae bacterium]|nr:toll/interleukin-1 receptor domain-containing protein [Synergistaceae bacterium]